jgi:hypothetical protein
MADIDYGDLEILARAQSKRGTGSSRFGTNNQGGGHRSRGVLGTTLTEVSKPTTHHAVPMWLDQKASLLIGL